MKTKQGKEESDRSIDDESTPEQNTKTRAQRKAADEELKANQEEPKTSKDSTTKKNVVNKHAKRLAKKPLGIRKTLRNKKVVVNKNKLKNAVKQPGRRGRKPMIKVELQEPGVSTDTITIIPPSEIKKEPSEEVSPSSRSSSPKAQGKRVRLSSEMAMMKSVLVDSPSPLVLGPRTSPYSMRSERSSSPSISDGKNRKGRKPKNLLNEVVKNEQKKRRLLSDTKSEQPDGVDEVKGRGRSYSRDGSEISKCSDMTESDLSLGDAGGDDSKVDNQELIQKLDKSKTELDVDIESSLPISTINTNVPFNDDSKLDHNVLADGGNKKKMSLKRSTSLDSDNNNSRNRIKLDNIRNSSDAEDKGKRKTDNDALLKTRSSILTSMSKTFNSKEVSMNIRKARRGRKAAAAPKATTIDDTKIDVLNGPSLTGIDTSEGLDSLSNEIKGIISTLEDDKLDGKLASKETPAVVSIENNTNPEMQTKCASKFYGLSELKPISDTISTPETPTKDKDSLSNSSTPSKHDENIRLYLDPDEESMDKTIEPVLDETTFKPVASIDKLMDRLKVFEEFDKKRQQTEHMKTGETKSVMVTNDVVLIPKSGADIKPLKDIQSVRSPERPVQNENVLSCFENNSAISIMKRDQVRKSMDVDLPNSITLIKRNSIHSRKESTGSNNSRESNDAIAIFEKSLGKDVTLTEIRKSVDKINTPAVDIQPFTTPPVTVTANLISVKIDSNEISITPRTNDQAKSSINKVRGDSKSGLIIEGADIETELIPAVVKSPIVLSKVTPTPPVAIKSPEAQPMETEALAPPLESVKTIPDNISMTSDTPKVQEMDIPESSVTNITEDKKVIDKENTLDTNIEVKEDIKQVEDIEEVKNEIKTVEERPVLDEVKELKESEQRASRKSTRKSLDNQAGPSNVLQESPERQKHKESVLRTLGLVTHKAAKEAKIEKELEKRMLAKNKTVKSDYTGTLKTIIKLNRGAEREKGKKYRSSLKMTFKTKQRAAKIPSEQGEPEGADDTFYTIERREATGTTAEGLRKSYSNRLNHDASIPAEVALDTSKDAPTLNLVIPEKASSFSIHPGRLCMDTCCYCGGKFGLFDTPCHIAQMKSADRQKKVLDNEEKLTIDSCLCDACYRHVDRRANCPSYRKRPLPKVLTMPDPVLTSTPIANNNISPPEKSIPSEKSISPTLEDESSGESASSVGASGAMCHTAGCGVAASHSIRRKWLIKMRSRVNDVLRLELDYPGLHTIPLCTNHYKALQPLMTCRLCLRNKHHNLHLLKHGYLELNPLLSKEGIPVEFTERPVLCKLCRYYCTLLQRPGYNDKHAKTYKIRLLKIYNIDVPQEVENDMEAKNLDQQYISMAAKAKKKNKIKNKQRKSSDQNQYNDVTEPIVEIREGVEKVDENHQTQDIENLISSNKILVPKPNSETQEITDQEMQELDGPLIPLDKQTELQYLLQKQNNPAQFLKKNMTNLTTKQKNIFKTLNITIQKSGQQQRILDKNAKKIQKIGQMIMQQERATAEEEIEATRDNSIIKNIPLNDECTIETIPNKKSADINALKNKWQMSESFTQVKRNLSELSKKSDKVTKSDGGIYSNPVRRLETNPSISVRELFPGEEEMNLQCNVDFNNVKGVTPEGWEKCSSTIQYDVETKKLWNELQRPYGNQSSFLRHLVILEKYFRNGDLVLSPNATGNAVVYADSVQNRLKAYDNVPSEPKRAEPTEFRKKNTNSLLKSNFVDDKNKSDETKKLMPPPPPVFVKPKSTKPLSEKMKNKPLPPELIAINTPNAQGRKAIQNVLHNIQQLVKGVSASDPTEIAAAPLLPPKVDSPKPEMPKLEVAKPPKKQKTTSKPWRPTLMPITPENLAKISREPPQIAVDGRSLPSLVQVLSSGKRYHITLFDYNKMCVMRREKLQQLQDGNEGKKATEPESIITEIQSPKLGNGGTLTQNIEKAVEKSPDITELSTLGISAANILKNVGLKNITIAPIPAKTSTVTSQSYSSPTTTNVTKMDALPMAMPKIPKSLTVIPQPIDSTLKTAP